LSSTIAPKMMFASGCAASATAFAASLTSHSERSRPPVIESRIDCAPSIDVSSSGDATACSAASIARLVARAHADARAAPPRLGHDRPHVGEVEVDEARQRDEVRDALHALAQHVVGDRNASTIDVPFSSTDSSRLLGTTMRVSTSSASASMPFSACCRRREPSKPNGFVTIPTVSAPSSRAIRATTGAAPVPVPPPARRR
jgi:hypothetical protein